MQTSPIINNLLDSLGEEPLAGEEANATTLLKQAEVAVDWLLRDYLYSWLELARGLVGCSYPQALAYRVRLNVIADMRLDLDTVAKGSSTEKVFFLAGLETHLRSLLSGMPGSPSSRSLQWGVDARDIGAAIGYGFREAAFLDDGIPGQVSACAMLTAFLVSQIVTDDGVAEEIAERMFVTKPMLLIEKLQELPAAPEA